MGLGQPGDKNRALRPHKAQAAPGEATRAQQKGPQLKAAPCGPQAAPGSELAPGRTAR